jgi:hypothetical protein
MSTPQRTEAPEVAIAGRALKSRRAVNAGIGLFLAAQVIVPLSYYLSDRDYDERFSWRMFSTLRVRDCHVKVTEFVGARGVPRTVDVQRDVHVSWLRLLERMRGAVIDAYLERRCADPTVQRVEFTSTCRDTDLTALPPLVRSLACRSSTETGTR